MFRLYDITWPIHPQMPVYKNRIEQAPRIEIVRDYEAGARESRITIHLHTGTHLDAPMHVDREGKSVERLSLLPLIGPCRVLDLTGIEERIEAKDLTGQSIAAGEFILLKTRNSVAGTASERFVYLEASGARYLAQVQVRGIGIDALGIERNQPGHPSHKLLLQEGIAVLEGLYLGEVAPGCYFLVALPLKIIGTEAAPLRAVLIAPETNTQT